MIILKSPHIPRGLGLPQLSTFLQLLSVLKGKKKKTDVILSNILAAEKTSCQFSHKARSPAAEAGLSFGDLAADSSEEAL